MVVYPCKGNSYGGWHFLTFVKGGEAYVGYTDDYHRTYPRL